MIFCPLGSRVLIRRVAADAKSAGGILIPDNTKEKPQEGEIVAVGSGEFESGAFVPTVTKPGDRVLFGKWAGLEVKIDGENLLIMKESDVLGVLEADDA